MAETPSEEKASSSSSSSTAAQPSLPPEAVAFAGRMFDAARAGQLDVFRQALPAGLPANLTNDKGDSLVMLAAYHGHNELLSLLLENGGDPNRLNMRGQSPLAGAVFKHERAVIETLVRAGADPEHGQPSAMQALDLFRADEWRDLFAQAPGRGRAGGSANISASTSAANGNVNAGDSASARAST